MVVLGFERQRRMFEAQFEPDLLGGVVALTSQVEAATAREWTGTLYSTEPPPVVSTERGSVGQTHGWPIFPHKRGRDFVDFD